MQADLGVTCRPRRCSCNSKGFPGREIRATQPEITMSKRSCCAAGFPELYACPEIDTAGFYRSYLATYLERDLRHCPQVSRTLRYYERFLREPQLCVPDSCSIGPSCLARRGHQWFDVRSVAIRPGGVRPSGLA